LLKPSYYLEPSELDRLVFEKLVPEDHLLRQVKQVIDFERVRELVKDCYSADMGRTAEDPVRLLKLGYLQFQYNLSDREVLTEAQVNVAFRYFLDLSLDSPLATVGLLSQFRTRLGAERYQAVFDEVVAQARAQGLVKDRLRLKDATHVIANIAVPSTIRLVGQVRHRLLESMRPYVPEQVAQAEARAAQIRQATADLKDEERLLQRVTHLRQIIACADELQARWGESAAPDAPSHQRFEQALALAHRVVDQTETPEQPDQVRSVVDPDARRGKHGHFYDGYQLDLSLDADSEIITAVDTPPANQDEAANAEKLVAHEERTQGNDVAAISLDGVGFRGDILRTLQDPTGLGLTVYVPPHPSSSDRVGYFTADDFGLVEDGQVCVCPVEEETRVRSRNPNNTAWVFYFKRSQCLGCLLRPRCMPALPTKSGRTVSKNDYQAEYAAARQLARTPAYAQVRQEHPKVERKLAELVRYHGARRARYWGRARVAIQFFLTAIVVNIKRILKLLRATVPLPAKVRCAST